MTLNLTGNSDATSLKERSPRFESTSALFSKNPAGMSRLSSESQAGLPRRPNGSVVISANPSASLTARHLSNRSAGSQSLFLRRLVIRLMGFVEINPRLVIGLCLLGHQVASLRLH